MKSIRIDPAFQSGYRKLLIATRHGDRVTLRNGDVTAADGYDPFAEYHLGDRFGRYDETIVRIERKRSTDLRPAWFQPKKRENHLALHSCGLAIYIETTFDKEKRAANHPFDLTLKTVVTEEPETLSLFD